MRERSPRLWRPDWRRIIIPLLGVCCAGAWAQTRPLNDTGITFSGGATSGNSTTCSTTHPAGQDCHYGRDAAARAGTLTKVGGSGGVNGFDFTKVCNSGEIAGSGTCPANPVVGYGTNEWGCTRDNVTGLYWEVKTTSGLRSMDHTYTWFKTGSPDGNNGTASGGTCATAGRCDTEKFTQDVNAQPIALCSFRDWRMPTVKELEGIVDYGRVNPAIDPTYFPNTPSWLVWTGSPYANNPSNAWLIYFQTGTPDYGNGPRSNTHHVRLVRGGQ